jgi:hypothetical protein
MPFRAFEQRVEDRAGLAGALASDKEPVLFAHCRRADGVLRQVGVDLNLSVSEEGQQLWPQSQGIVDGTAQRAFRQHGCIGTEPEQILPQSFNDGLAVALPDK